MEHRQGCRWVVRPEWYVHRPGMAPFVVERYYDIETGELVPDMGGVREAWYSLRRLARWERYWLSSA